MNKQKLFEKWCGQHGYYGKGGPSPFLPEKKKEFMRDLRSLIKKHQQPFIEALNNIIYDVAQKIESEVSDAKVIAKRLG